MKNSSLYRAGLLLVASFALGGCAGEVTDEGDDAGDLEISSSEEALSVGDVVETSAAASPDEVDCNDDDDDDKDGKHHRRHHHRKHKFKLLDRLDGTKDKIITIAALPAGLPPHLLAKLAKMDTNHDGLVSREEVKVWIRR